MARERTGSDRCRKPPKPRARGTGSVCEFRDEQNRIRFKVGVSVPQGYVTKSGKIRYRKWERLEVGTTRACAEATAADWSKNAPTLPGALPAPGGETLTDWTKRWLADRSARGIQTDVDRGRLKVHVLPTLGPKAVAAVSKSELEGIVETLDRKVQAGEIKWKTARNVWGIVSKAFDDAANAKTRALRVRDGNPAAGVRGPDRGERTLKQYLYPSEFLEFVSCEDVPIAWRRLVALNVLLYVRLGELEALEWEDVDLDRGIIHVHRAINREDGETKATKTDTPRKFAIEPVLLPLLHAMFVESDGEGCVIALPSETNHARALRTYLMRAGVDRAELHTPGDKSRKQMTAYDLRATGITWRAVRGDDPLKIMSAAGHRSFATTQGYIREAEPLREGFGTVFPPLPARLLTGPQLLRKCSAKSQRDEIIVPKEGLEPPPADEIVENRRESSREGPSLPPSALDAKYADDGSRSRSGADADSVETALAAALEKATEAGRWDVVAQLAKELEARRLARTAPNVVAMSRKGREGGQR